MGLHVGVKKSTLYRKKCDVRWCIWSESWVGRLNGWRTMLLSCPTSMMNWLHMYTSSPCRFTNLVGALRWYGTPLSCQCAHMSTGHSAIRGCCPCLLSDLWQPTSALNLWSNCCSEFALFSYYLLLFVLLMLFIPCGVILSICFILCVTEIGKKI